MIKNFFAHKMNKPYVISIARNQIFPMQKSDFKNSIGPKSYKPKTAKIEKFRKTYFLLYFQPQKIFLNRYRLTGYTIEKLRKFPIRWYNMSFCTSYFQVRTKFYCTTIDKERRDWQTLFGVLTIPSRFIDEKTK